MAGITEVTLKRKSAVFCSRRQFPVDFSQSVVRCVHRIPRSCCLVQLTFISHCSHIWTFCCRNGGTLAYSGTRRNMEESPPLSCPRKTFGFQILYSSTSKSTASAWYSALYHMVGGRPCPSVCLSVYSSSPAFSKISLQSISLDFFSINISPWTGVPLALES